MNEILVGILAILVGLVFSFQGFMALRLVIGIWGAFVGFAGGMSIMNWATGNFFGNVVAWIVALGMALVVGALAYLFYAVGVVILMGSIGYGLGAGLTSLVGFPTLIAVIVGLGVAFVFVLLALLTNLPRLVLIVLSAAAGAVAITGGLMLVFNEIDLEQLSGDSMRALIGDHWWWNLVYLVLLFAGIVVQWRLGVKTDLRMAYNLESAVGGTTTSSAA